MVRVAAEGLRDDLLELGLDLVDRLAGREAGAVADAEDVGVDREGLLAEGGVEHDVGGLAADAGQRLQLFAGARAPRRRDRSISAWLSAMTFFALVLNRPMVLIASRSASSPSATICRGVLMRANSGRRGDVDARRRSPAPRAPRRPAAGRGCRIRARSSATGWPPPGGGRTRKPARASFEVRPAPCRAGSAPLRNPASAGRSRRGNGRASRTSGRGRPTCRNARGDDASSRCVSPPLQRGKAVMPCSARRAFEIVRGPR